jgi:hypothetical protein
MLSSKPRPSQKPVDGGEPRIQFPSPFVVDAVIDGLPYHLPHPGQPPVDIMLTDGSLAQLLAGTVVLRGQTLSIPSDVRNPQAIAGNGLSITAQPGRSSKPDPGNSDDGGHGGGGGGPFAFLGKIAGAAGSAAKAMGGTASGAMSFAAGAAGTGGAAASQLSKTLSGAVGGAGSVVSSLNGIQEAFPLESLTQAGMNAFLGAQNLGRNSMDWMQSVGKVLEGFDNLKPEIQQQVLNNIREYAKPGGQLQKASEAMKALSDFPWEAEAPETELPSPTATPQPTKSAQETKMTSIQSSKSTVSTNTKTTLTSASSSSAGPSSTELPLPYYIATKWGTPVETFKKFIEELDGGAGKAKYDDLEKMDYQTYKTKLNISQAEGLKSRYPFLLLAYADISHPSEFESDNEEFHAIPRYGGSHSTTTEASLHRREIKAVDLSEETASLNLRALRVQEAPYWKKMISSPFRKPPLLPTDQDPSYAADDSEGRGTTIYVLDNGFELTRPVSIFLMHSRISLI